MPSESPSPPTVSLHLCAITKDFNEKRKIFQAVFSLAVRPNDARFLPSSHRIKHLVEQE